MTENPEAFKEVNQAPIESAIEVKFRQEPIAEFSSEEIADLRRQLTENGSCDFQKLEPEHLASLKESQIRADLTEGRGPGMVAVMGETGVVALRTWCREKSEGWKRLKKAGGEPVEGSEGRGLQQLAVDIITMATGRLNEDELKSLTARMNRRIAKGYLQEAASPEEKEQIRKRFMIEEELPKTLASVPPGTATELLLYLLSKK